MVCKYLLFNFAFIAHKNYTPWYVKEGNILGQRYLWYVYTVEGFFDHRVFPGEM
jgi:hypothetical protein